MQEDFSIHYYAGKWYRSKVFITYNTINVIRFTVKGGDKELYLEKHLFKKSHQWQFQKQKSNFNITHLSRQNENYLETIFSAIDRIIENDNKRVVIRV